MMTRGPLVCAYCNRKKSRDAFPVSIYAECWQCYWDAHVREKHPKHWWHRFIP